MAGMPSSACRSGVSRMALLCTPARFGRICAKPPGWSVPAYKAWLFTALVQQLLGLPQPDPEALRGLSFASLVDAI